MRSRLMPTALAVAALLAPLFLVSCESTGSEAAAVQEGAVRAGMPTMAARDTQEEFGPYMRPTPGRTGSRTTRGGRSPRVGRSTLRAQTGSGSPRAGRLAWMGDPMRVSDDGTTLSTP